MNFRYYISNDATMSISVYNYLDLRHTRGETLDNDFDITALRGERADCEAVLLTAGYVQSSQSRTISSTLLEGDPIGPMDRQGPLTSGVECQSSSCKMIAIH